MGDFNGDLGNSLGNKGKREPNQHGLKLLNHANYFNPIQYGLFLKHYSMGGGIMAPPCNFAVS